MMQSAVQPAPTSKAMVWSGYIISALPVLALLFAGGIKLTKSASMVQGMAQYGFPANLVLVIGILEVACTIIYVIPRTAVLGAILMTAFLGGATVANVRVGNPSYVVTVVLGILVWLGLYLRDGRVRELIPLRRNE
jgi:DoxX-like protein